MIGMMGRLPQLLRSLIALGFGAFWGYLALDIGPMAGPATQMGLGVLAIIAIMGGLIGLLRAAGPSGATMTKAIGPATKEPEPFDADAALERYLARKNGR